MEGKLNNLSSTFTCLGLICTFVILGTSLVAQIIQTGFFDDFTATLFVKKFIENLTIALVLLIVAIPEGLTMTAAVSIS